MLYIERKLYVDPLIKTIGMAHYKEFFGEDFDVDKKLDLNTRNLILNKMILLAINFELEKCLPNFYNVKEIYQNTFSSSEEDYNNFINAKYVDDLKFEYYDDIIESLNSLLENYDCLKSKTKVCCSEESVKEYKTLIERYYNNLKSAIENGDIILKSIQKTNKREKRVDIKVYFSESEKEFLKKQAKKNGKTLSRYIREKMLK